MVAILAAISILLSGDPCGNKEVVRHEDFRNEYVNILLESVGETCQTAPDHVELHTREGKVRMHLRCCENGVATYFKPKKFSRMEDKRAIRKASYTIPANRSPNRFENRFDNEQ